MDASGQLRHVGFWRADELPQNTQRLRHAGRRVVDHMRQETRHHFPPADRPEGIGSLIARRVAFIVDPVDDSLNVLVGFGPLLDPVEHIQAARTDAKADHITIDRLERLAHDRADFTTGITTVRLKAE